MKLFDLENWSRGKLSKIGQNSRKKRDLQFLQ